MSDKRIFAGLIEECKPKFPLTTMFGIPLTELDAEELRACVCVLGQEKEAAMRDRIHEREMMTLFRKAANGR